MRILPFLFLAGCAKGWPGPVPSEAVNAGTCFVATSFDIFSDLYLGISSRPIRGPAINYDYRACGIALPDVDVPCEVKAWTDLIGAYVPPIVGSLSKDAYAGGWPEVLLAECAP